MYPCIQPLPTMRFQPFHDLLETTVCVFFKYLLLLCILLSKLCWFLMLLRKPMPNSTSLQCQTHVYYIPSLLGDCEFVYDRCTSNFHKTFFTSQQLAQKYTYFSEHDLFRQAAFECPNIEGVKTVYISTNECNFPISTPFFTYEIENVGIPYRIDASKIKEEVWLSMLH